MKRIVVLALVLCLATPLIAQPNPYRESTAFTPTAKDPDLQRLLRIRDSLTQRLADREVDLGQLKYAYENNDTAGVRSLLGMSESEEQQVNRDIQESTANLMRKHPEALKRSPYTSTCQATNDDVAFRAIGKRVQQMKKEATLSTFDSVEDDDPGDTFVPTTCLWFQYLAMQMLCAIQVPGFISYLACSYIAVCFYCSGTNIDYICQ